MRTGLRNYTLFTLCTCLVYFFVFACARAGQGTWELPAEDQLKPCTLAEDAFKAAAAALSGFNESSSKLVLVDPALVNARVLATANLLAVGSGYRAEVGVGRWAAVTPAGHRVLLQVESSGGATATVTLKCDDALVANTLLDVVKKGLSA
jgi:hypothetical protein